MYKESTFSFLRVVSRLGYVILTLGNPKIFEAMHLIAHIFYFKVNITLCCDFTAREIDCLHIDYLLEWTE